MTRCSLCGFHFEPEADVITCDVCRERLAQKTAAENDQKRSELAAEYPLVKLGPGGDFVRDIAASEIG